MFTVALIAPPLVVFAVLLMLGQLSATAAGAAGMVTTAAALILARLWREDLHRLLRMARRVNADDVEPLGSGRPRFPQAAEIGREIERVSRDLATRSMQFGQVRRADEMVVERLPDPLIVLAADRSVQRANAAARAAYGSDIQAVLRKPDLRIAIDRAFTQRSTQTADASLQVPVAREVHATVIFMDMPLSDGGQAVLVLSDRTHERAVERMRADFVANASHELRTPLASLIGFIDTLRGPAADDPPAQRRFLQIMGEQAARMNRLIDDLLSLSRVELTEHQAPAGLVDLTDLLPRLADAFEPQVQERAVKLEIDMAPSLPPVRADADQLAQVVQNLLDNAVKYGRPHGTVRLRAERSAPDQQWPGRAGVVFSVADDGQGIASKHLPRLTERFYRADEGRSRAVGGTGLGLAIVKHIVNRHRGLLRIESQEEIGTTVSIWLPAAAEQGAVEEPVRGVADRR